MTDARFTELFGILNTAALQDEQNFYADHADSLPVLDIPEPLRDSIFGSLTIEEREEYQARIAEVICG